MNKLLQLIAALALGFAAVDNAAGQSKPAENPIIWADGMQTRTITLANLDKFSHIGIFSGGSIAPTNITDMAAFKQKVKAVFVSYGSREVTGGRGMGANGKANADALKEAGVNSHYYESPLTAHEWQSWRRSLYQFAPLLFQD